MTLIVLLILAGASLNGLFNEKGLFKRTENASNRYNEAKAREVLETVLLADGQYEKNTNQEYNQDDFLDDLIKSEIPGSDVKGDVAIIGEYAYELDRSVPKIGRYLGKASDLVFPTITASTPVLADDYRSSTFTVTALEETNGINKMEIWFAGERIETLTKTYSNIKTEIKEDFTVNRNGTYIIKAYGDLMASTTVEVTGIVPAVEFSPNGSTEWKKQHTTKITVKETGERVTSLKYKWTNSVNPPKEGDFSDAEICNNNDTITGGNNTMTGAYYLWVLVEMDTNPVKTNICGSGAFNFDNTAPTAELLTEWIEETTRNRLKIIISNTQDEHSGVNESAKIYVTPENGVREEKSVKLTNGTGEIIIDELNMEQLTKIECVVADNAGNTVNISKNVGRMYLVKNGKILGTVSAGGKGSDAVETDNGTVALGAVLERRKRKSWLGRN